MRVLDPVCRVEANQLKWARYFDTYHPFPPRGEAPAARFYEELLSMRAAWERALEPAMRIEIPDQRLADMARHSLVRASNTASSPTTSGSCCGVTLCGQSVALPP